MLFIILYNTYAYVWLLGGIMKKNQQDQELHEIGVQDDQRRRKEKQKLLHQRRKQERKRKYATGLVGKRNG